MQIDLEPHEFSSKRNRKNANAHGLLALVAFAMLAYVWWHRHEVTLDTLFTASAATAGLVGAGLIVFFNQWRGL